jgi:phosphatidylethanolamine/phosphatidyl-N-methylethanolamine N-methyltransferase
MEDIKSKFVFFAQFFKEFQAMGSFCSTSKWAAKALTEPLVGPRKTMRILEAGPGTGSVTDQILKRMRTGDELVLCELNPRLMAILKRNLARHPLFDIHKNRISFFEGPVQELPGSQPFDVIVCAIPFLNLPVPVVKEIFARFRELSHEKTVMTYYEYIMMRELGKAISKTRRSRVSQLEPFLQEVWEQTNTQRKQVWRNVLPVNVYRLESLGQAPALAA